MRNQEIMSFRKALGLRTKNRTTLTIQAPLVDCPSGHSRYWDHHELDGTPGPYSRDSSLFIPRIIYIERNEEHLRWVLTMLQKTRQTFGNLMDSKKE